MAERVRETQERKLYGLVPTTGVLGGGPRPNTIAWEAAGKMEVLLPGPRRGILELPATCSDNLRWGGGLEHDTHRGKTDVQRKPYKAVG